MKPVIALLLIVLLLSLGACPSPQETIGAKVFVGSVNSDIYHYPHCEWAKKIHNENQIWFSSSSDAHSKGYRACKVCRPP